MENKKYDTLRKRRKEILIFCNADSFPSSFAVSLLAKTKGVVKLKNLEGFAFYMLTFADDRNWLIRQVEVEA